MGIMVTLEIILDMADMGVIEDMEVMGIMEGDIIPVMEVMGVMGVLQAMALEVTTII